MNGPLIKRRKKLARALLYLTPVVLAAATLLVIRHFEDLGFKDWSEQKWLDLEEVQLLQRYLQIDTSYPSGSEIPGAEFLAGVLAENGIEAKVERIGEKHAALIATLEGEDPRALVLHHHIDVLRPFDPEKAKFPPFSGHIDPPFIYGRGAFDMKSYGIAQLMAMLELKRSGRKLKRSLTLLGTGDEEVEGMLGVHFLLSEHPEWKQQFWGVITEGGAVEALDIDRARYWGTEFAQKMLVRIKVCDTRRERLADLAEELAAVAPVRRVMPELIPFFKEYGVHRDRPATRRLLAEPEKLLERIRSYPGDVDVTVIPPYIEVMLADELQVQPVMPREGEPGVWELYLILWVLPGRTVEQAYGELIGDRLDGFQVEIRANYSMAVASPIDHPLFTGIDSFMEEKHPEVKHGPLFIPWAASESRYFRPAGIPTYGFTPFWILSSDAASMKGVNERLPLPAFVHGVELYRELVEELVAEDGGWWGDN